MIDDGNNWSTEGRNILSPDRLEIIRKEMDERGPVILEHWHYYGSRAPDHFVFNDLDELMEYLRAKARPGDALHVWSFAALCLDDNTLTDGKYPDADGRVPQRGAY